MMLVINSTVMLCEHQNFDLYTGYWCYALVVERWIYFLTAPFKEVSLTSTSQQCRALTACAMKQNLWLI